MAIGARRSTLDDDASNRVTAGGTLASAADAALPGQNGGHDSRGANATVALAMRASSATLPASAAASDASSPTLRLAGETVMTGEQLCAEEAATAPQTELIEGKATRR